MVQTQLTREYFEKISVNASRSVVVSGAAHMEYVARRRLRRLQQDGGSANTDDAKFDVEIAINAAALPTAYGIVISVIMVIATLM